MQSLSFGRHGLMLEMIVSWRVVVLVSLLGDGLLGANVDFECTLTVDAVKRELHVTSDHGRWVGDGSRSDASLEERLRHRPLFCGVGRERLEASVALLSLATDVGYLRSVKRSEPHGTSIDILEALASKARYAASAEMPFFVWLGALRPSLLQREAKSTCRDEANSTGHAYKSLAMATLFAHRPKLDALL